MKIIPGIFLILLAIGCENNNIQKQPVTTLTPLPTSMKGYELYSWSTNDNEHWNYTLITGTNKLKTHDEIVSSDNIEDSGWVKITVQDTPALLKLLQRLPAKQSVLWQTSPMWIDGFSVPPSPIVTQIEQQSKALKLDLHVN